MSNKTYDTLKNIALFAVPITTFISSVVNIIGIPYADVITACLTALDTCLGGIVIEAKKIHDGKTDEGEEDA